MAYYIDACIWIDFIEGRTDDFLIKCIQEEHSVIISNFLLNEIFRYELPMSIRMIISILESKGLLRKINASNVQDQEAARISKNRNVPFGDALHAVLARDNDAIVVTRDKHFLMLRDICNIELL